MQGGGTKIPAVGVSFTDYSDGSPVIRKLLQIARRRWNWALNVGLLVIFCWLLAQWTWRVLPPKSRPLADGVQLHSVSATAEKVASSHLFGHSTGFSALVATQISSSSNLKLQGVFAALGSLPAFAILSVDGKPATPFQAGKEVLQGLMLESVQPDYVMLRRQGVLERLDLQKAVAVSVSPALNEFKLNVQQRGGNVFSLSRKELNLALQDAKQLANLGRMSPHPGSGMRVEDAPSGSLASKLGLQVGDVVKNFNGKPVKSNEDVQRFVQQLGQTDQARLFVMRGGSVMQLQYQIQP